MINPESILPNTDICDGFFLTWKGQGLSWLWQVDSPTPPKMAEPRALEPEVQLFNLSSPDSVL